jgi:hypothetical protein
MPFLHSNARASCSRISIMVSRVPARRRAFLWFWIC